MAKRWIFKIKMMLRWMCMRFLQQVWDQLCRQADPASWQTCAHLNVGSLAFEGVEASLTNVCGPRSTWQCALCWLQAASLLHWHAKTPMGGTRQLDSTRVSGSLTSQRCSDILSTCHLQQGCLWWIQTSRFKLQNSQVLLNDPQTGRLSFRREWNSAVTMTGLRMRMLHPCGVGLLVESWWDCLWSSSCRSLCAVAWQNSTVRPGSQAAAN